MRYLAIDTATQTASVAVIEEQMLIGEMVMNTPLTHSQKLMPMIETLIGQLDLKISDFDGFIVCEGPGSFTGVRIGLSTVKAFAQVHKKPVITISSMHLLALGNAQHKGLVVSVLDAKRKEVYYGIYRVTEHEVTLIEEDVKPLAVLFDALEADYVGERIHFVGDAVSIYSDAFEEIKTLWNRNNYTLGRGNQHIIKASSMVYMDIEAFEPVSYDAVKANYMRKSQAERDQESKEK